MTSLKYNINQPTLFIKGDTIKPISLYKTSYSGEDVTYNPGMDELLLAGSGEITSSVLINYNANTHLTFSLSKGKLFEYTNLNNTLQDRNLEAYPVMPELSAYAKQESTKTIGRADGQVIFYIYTGGLLSLLSGLIFILMRLIVLQSLVREGSGKLLLKWLCNLVLNYQSV